MSGRRPLAGVRLRVFQAVPFDEQSVDVTSAADGSFSVAAPDSMNFSWVQLLAGSPYYSPCPPFTWSQAMRVDLDVHVVSGAILSTEGMPPSYPAGSHSGGGYVALISGQVVERTTGGLEPVSGVTVAMGKTRPVVEANALADTLTDANGRYVLCSIGNTEVGVTVSARKPGYSTASASGLPWFGWSLDFELVRQ